MESNSSFLLSQNFASLSEDLKTAYFKTCDNAKEISNNAKEITISNNAREIAICKSNNAREIVISNNAREIAKLRVRVDSQSHEQVEGNYKNQWILLIQFALEAYVDIFEHQSRCDSNVFISIRTIWIKSIAAYIKSIATC